jgi:DNA mismatch repair protein MutL
MERRELNVAGPGPLPEVGISAAPSPLLPEEEQVPAPLIPGLPALRVFGQANQMFIIAEGPDGLYMIDQHAAHERILFDRLDAELAGRSARSQPLLQPASLDLAPGQMAALEQNAELLSVLGFVVEPFGHGACLVRCVPAMARGKPGELVAEVLHELEGCTEPTAARERALASLACQAAVKAGQTLDVREMRELVAQLEQTLRPSTCPHGRPTMIHLSHSQLERQFGR